MITAITVPLKIISRFVNVIEFSSSDNMLISENGNKNQNAI